MRDDQFEDGDLTRRIIGCAMRVHGVIGCGFQEIIYQNALSIELRKEGVSFCCEVEMPIYYEGELVGTRRADILVEQRVAIELKAVSNLEDIHLAQAKNYLEAYRLRVGLLINFGARSLQFKRLINSKIPLPLPAIGRPQGIADTKSMNRPRNPLQSASSRF